MGLRSFRTVQTRSLTGTEDLQEPTGGDGPRRHRGPVEDLRSWTITELTCDVEDDTRRGVGRLFWVARVR